VGIGKASRDLVRRSRLLPPLLAKPHQGMEQPVIELVIAACLATGECRETRLTYDARDVSLITCMVTGQAEIARWQQQHPRWRVKRWHCGIARQYGQVL
jgi:hypothetical protein